MRDKRTPKDVCGEATNSKEKQFKYVDKFQFMHERVTVVLFPLRSICLFNKKGQSISDP